MREKEPRRDGVGRRPFEVVPQEAEGGGMVVGATRGGRRSMRRGA
jgi:hypothetical protein